MSEILVYGVVAVSEDEAAALDYDAVKVQMLVIDKIAVLRKMMSVNAIRDAINKSRRANEESATVPATATAT